MSNHTHLPRAQMLDNVHVHVISTYIDDHGMRVHVSQHGRLVPVALIKEHQSRNNVRGDALNIPCFGLHTSRIVGDVPTSINPIEWAYMHPTTVHHGSRVIQMEWRVTINGVVYKEYDTKRNYERRVRDLANVVKRFLDAWEDD